jgi:hypothetical protein
MTSSSSGAAWRVALFFFLTAGVLWFGGANIRTIIGNQLLRPGTLEFDAYIAPEAEREIFRLLSIIAVVIIAGYLVTFTAGLLFLWASPLVLREHGWLMLCAVLFYGCAPVEIYALWLDGVMVYKEFFTTADNAVFRDLFLQRATALGGAHFIALLCYYTIIGVAVFQPFRRPAVRA